MNDNEGTIPQQIVHLESIANMMREDLREHALRTPGEARRREAREAGGSAQRPVEGSDEEGGAAQEEGAASLNRIFSPLRA
jgi:hypothetical protein